MLRNRIVCPLTESILLRSIGYRGFPPDANRIKICLEDIAHVFTTIITSEAFNFASRSKFYSPAEILKAEENSGLLSNWV